MPDYEIILNAVTRVTGVSKAKMLSRSRLWPIVEARMLFILFMSRCGSTDEKSSWVLRRNRTTITKSRRIAAEYIGISLTFKEKFDKITEIYDTAKSI